MRIATWNVNSVRARLDRLCAWLGRTQPDIVCLQEIKSQSESFPREAVAALGYRAEVYGQKTYNGVAILSRTPITEVDSGLLDGVADLQARLLCGVIAGLRVVNVYVPNGGEVGGEKWTYKLEWLARLRRYLERTAVSDQPLCVCGDFNIAPTDDDIRHPDAWQGSVLCHPEARARFNELLTLGLSDLYRRCHPDGRDLSWWDYRQLGFVRDDGLRIDLILGNAAASERCRTVHIDRDERKGEKPSDHAPVIAEMV